MFKKNLLSGTALFLTGMGVLGLPTSGIAETIYATSINTSQIFTVDTVTHVVTPIFTAPSPLDSLFFDQTGRIIYSELDAGTVAAFNPNTHSNVTLATGLSGPIDLALEPSLTSFLVSDSNSNSLSRVSLSGGVIGAALPLGLRPDGIIYDNMGRLFVNVSTGFTANDSQVEQIDPTTGAVLHTSGSLGIFLDGLTYDSSTGMLFASDYNNGRIVEINPNTLTFTILTPLGAALAPGGPDGIDSDGLGNLFIASRANSEVVQYTIATNTDVDIASINGLDDLAPVSGLGAPTVPEPASLPLLAAGIAAFAWLRRKFT